MLNINYRYKCMDKESKQSWSSSGYFGHSMVVHGNSLVIGAPSASTTNGSISKPVSKNNITGSILQFTKPFNSCDFTMPLKQNEANFTMPWYHDRYDGVAELYTGLTFISDGESTLFGFFGHSMEDLCFTL